MKLEKVKNAKKNILWGMIYKVASIVIPFILRIVMVKELGSEYLGLQSLFGSILQVLSLTELGFGSAIVFSMYDPIANDDINTLCLLLGFYRKIYRMVGCGILGLGLIITPFIPMLINGNWPKDINIYFLYILYVINSAVSYFLFAYRRALIIAYQKNNIESAIQTIIMSLSGIGQIVVLMTIKSYYLFFIVTMISTIFSNLCIAIYTKRKFPEILCRGELTDKIQSQIKKKVSGILLSKICVMSRNAFDSIFVSSFLGLLETAKYNNYYYVINAVTTFLLICGQAIQAGVGNSIVTETKEKNYMDLKKFTFMYLWISGICVVCLLCLYQPFISLFFGSEMLLPMYMVNMLCVYFFSSKLSDMRFVFLDALGLWHENKLFYVVEAISNIILNYCLGKYLGLFGIVLSTNITILIFNYMLESTVIFRKYFHKEQFYDDLKSHLIYICVILFSCFICIKVTELIIVQGIAGIIFKAMISFVFVNVIFIISYRKMNIYKIIKVWIMKNL